MNAERLMTFDVPQTLYAGMAFHLPGETFDTASVAAHVSQLFADIGIENWPAPCDDPMAAVLTCNDCTVSLKIARDGEVSWLTVGITPIDLVLTPDYAEALLAQMVGAIMSTMTPAAVSWLEPDALLAPKDFLTMLYGTEAVERDEAEASAREKADKAASEEKASVVLTLVDADDNADDTDEIDNIFAPEPPAPPSLRPNIIARCGCEDAKPRPLRQTRDADKAIAKAIRHAPTREELGEEFGDDAVPDTDVRRLSVWFMTIALMIIALPAAAILTVVNLFRGEDFRFASQIVALTALAMALETSGAIAAIQ